MSWQTTVLTYGTSSEAPDNWGTLISILQLVWPQTSFSTSDLKEEWSTRRMLTPGSKLQHSPPRQLLFYVLFKEQEYSEAFPEHRPMDPVIPATCFYYVISQMFRRITPQTPVCMSPGLTQCWLCIWVLASTFLPLKNQTPDSTPFLSHFLSFSTSSHYSVVASPPHFHWTHFWIPLLQAMLQFPPLSLTNMYMTSLQSQTIGITWNNHSRLQNLKMNNLPQCQDAFQCVSSCSFSSQPKYSAVILTTGGLSVVWTSPRR